jgi:hypothetical protein
LRGLIQVDPHFTKGSEFAVNIGRAAQFAAFPWIAVLVGTVLFPGVFAGRDDHSKTSHCPGLSL